MSYACNSLGLGELLPPRSYVGVLPITAANWSDFESGAAHGGNWEQFREAASLGWVPYSPEGYANFLGWWQASSGDRLAAGLYELQGWIFARIPVPPSTLQASLAAYLKNGEVDQAGAQAVADAYNHYAGTAVTATVAPAAPTPDPNYPPGIQLLLAGPPVTEPNGGAAGLVIGYRTSVVYTGSLGPGMGNVQQGPWTATPANWLTMLGVEWRGGADPTKGIYGSRWVGLDPDIPQRFVDEAARELATDPYNAFSPRLAADTPAFQAWLASELPTWTGPVGPAEIPAAPAPLPGPVPIIPGSTVLVPGGGAEPQIILPGSTTPIPVSQIPVGWTDVTAAPPPPGTTGATPSSPTPAGSPLPGPIYSMPGAPYPTPGTPAEPAPVQQAGISSGLLIGGGLLAAVLLLSGKRGRRPRRR